jgi:uncharacterized protein (TIGR00255 family)
VGTYAGSSLLEIADSFVFFVFKLSEFVNSQRMFSMIKSMTGYGNCRAELNGREIDVEIKSVNHKFFECGVRIGRAYSFLEDKIKKYCGESISRGKIDININITGLDGDDVKITANKAVLDGYISAVKDYARGADTPIEHDLTYSVLLRIPDGFIIQKAMPDEESIWADVKSVLDGALCGLSDMRKVEGEKLREDIIGQLESIDKNVDRIDVLSPESVEIYRKKLTEKLCEMIESKVDEGRILTDAAIFADKTAVFEETVRLKSHIVQFQSFLESDFPVGRKMDFLTQEMNREANTIGSKAQDIEITRLVLEIKSDIEKIREQVQNIE